MTQFETITLKALAYLLNGPARDAPARDAIVQEIHDMLNPVPEVVDDSKPQWANAPSCAKYLACDSDGEWWWFEDEPKIADRSPFGCGWWAPSGSGNCEVALIAGDLVKNPSWEQSMEKRP